MTNKVEKYISESLNQTLKERQQQQEQAKEAKEKEKQSKGE